MLNKEIMAKLTTALRSGEYKQTQGVLKDCDGGMCCLGVLSDIYAKETGKGKWDETSVVDNNSMTSCHAFVIPVSEQKKSSNTDFPASEVLDWAGFTRGEFGYAHRPSYPFATELAGENDHGKTFPKIADMIDAKIAAEEKAKEERELTPTS